MVCVPCIILPVVLAIYIRFIQPLIMHLIPERWRVAFDSVLYPTCPIAQPKNDTTTTEEPQATLETEQQENKKDN